MEGDERLDTLPIVPQDDDDEGDSFGAGNSSGTDHETQMSAGSVGLRGMRSSR